MTLDGPMVALVYRAARCSIFDSERLVFCDQDGIERTLLWRRCNANLLRLNPAWRQFPRLVAVRYVPNYVEFWDTLLYRLCFPRRTWFNGERKNACREFVNTLRDCGWGTADGT
jgi:hypothetical protein